MLTQLIASRPDHRGETRGLAFSVLLHASILAAALLTARPISDALGDIYEPRMIPLTVPAEPAPAAPAAPRAMPATPREPVPTELPVPTPPIVAPTSIPVTIPEPSTSAWTGPMPGATSGGGVDGGVGVPAGLPGGTAIDGVLSDAQVDEAAALLPRSPLPRYPDALRSWRVEGHARLRFVVGTDGRVEPEGIEVLESSHPAFAAAVRAALPRMRFSPAKVGDRRVRQLVEFPITFRFDP